MPNVRGGLTQDYYDLKKFISESDKTVMAVGFLGGETYPSGEQVGDVAEKNEFGEVSENTPPRPFMRPAMLEIEDNAPRVIADKLKSGERDMKVMFDELGKYSVYEVVEAIKSVHTPKLAISTIHERIKRGNTSIKPLEDSGKMINSVNFEVINE